MISLFKAPGMGMEQRAVSAVQHFFDQQGYVHVIEVFKNVLEVGSTDGKRFDTAHTGSSPAVLSLLFVLQSKTALCLEIRAVVPRCDKRHYRLGLR